MSETQLFYLTIIVALLILYLIVSKICEVYETKYKALAISNMVVTDIGENEEIKEKLMEAIDNMEVNIDDRGK